MPSTFIKWLLTYTSISPALLILYIDRIIRNYKHLSFYVKVGSTHEILAGLLNFLFLHYLLLLFVLFVLAAGGTLRLVKTTFSRHRIYVKSIKSGDYNFISVWSSFIPALIKHFKPEAPDWALLLVFVGIGVLLAIVFSTAYHFNVILRYIYQYKYYEIGTKGEVTYFMLSKKKLINPKDISEYVQLADHMIVNIS
jgi:hypothetical protein